MTSAAVPDLMAAFVAALLYVIEIAPFVTVTVVTYLPAIVGVVAYMFARLAGMDPCEV